MGVIPFELRGLVVGWVCDPAHHRLAPDADEVQALGIVMALLCATLFADFKQQVVKIEERGAFVDEFRLATLESPAVASTRSSQSHMPSLIIQPTHRTDAYSLYWSSLTY